jgi:hypothetical protein
MRQQALVLLMSVALTGCISVGPNPQEQQPGCGGSYGRGMGPPSVPGLKGPHGESVPMAAPYSSAPPMSAYQAQRMMQNHVDMGMVQMMGPAGGGTMMAGAGPGGGMMPPTLVPGGRLLSPPGVPSLPGMPAGTDVMQAKFNPGGMPGGMPGPGGMRGGLPSSPMMPFMGGMPPGGMPPGGMPQGGMPPGMPPPPEGLMRAMMAAGGMNNGMVQQAQFTQPTMSLPYGGGGQGYAGQRTQVRFNRPVGMKVFWFSQGPDGKPMYSTTPIETPGRYNFQQGAIYRLKLTNIKDRPELPVYPTMEVVQSNPRTEAFLSHSAVPVDFTDQDFKEVVDGNYVIKVIYLPDPQYQDEAGTGTSEILSTRLEPGTDPIMEARRRGSILLVIRMGNLHQELDHSPPLGATGNNQAAKPAMPTGPGMQGMPHMPAMPQHLSHGPGFGPDYPNKPLMQVPYYGQGIGNPGSGIPGGTPPSLPNLPPAQGYNPNGPTNPGAAAGVNPPNYFVPPAKAAEEPVKSAPTFGSSSSLPPTNLAPSLPVPPAALPTSPGANLPAPPSGLSGPPSSLSGPPSSLGGPPSSLSSPPASFLAPPNLGGNTGVVPNNPPKNVLRRPSIFSDPPETPKTAPVPVGSSDGLVLPPTLPSSLPPPTSSGEPAAKNVPTPPKTEPEIALPSPGLPNLPPVANPKVPDLVAPKVPEGPPSNLSGPPGKPAGPGEIPLPVLPNAVGTERKPSSVSLPPAPPVVSPVPEVSKVPEPRLPEPPPSPEVKLPGSSQARPENTDLPRIPEVKIPEGGVNPGESPAFPPTPGEINPAGPDNSSSKGVPSELNELPPPTSQANPGNGVQRAIFEEPASAMPTTAELAGQVRGKGR